MTFLNRRDRRTKDKQERSVVRQDYREVGLPSILGSFTIFDGVDRILKSILKGELEFRTLKDDKEWPVYRTNTGEYEEVIPSLLRWCETWTKVKERDIGVKYINIEALSTVNKALYDRRFVTHEEIKAAVDEFDKLRWFYNQLRPIQRNMIQTIAIEYERSVLIERLEKSLKGEPK